MNMVSVQPLTDFKLSAAAPVGVFDSGVGGLSVLQEIRRILPGEDLLYVADSGNVPYGNKKQAFIRDRSLVLAGFLLDMGAKTLIIACNTATAAAAGFLRSRLSVPIVAMEAAVRPATAATRSGVVGVLATIGTLSNARFAALLERFGKGVRIVVQACPGLVEQVEAGDLSGPATRRLVECYTAPLREEGTDVIVLGCTHYAFLRAVITDVVGPGVVLIDTGNAVALQLRRVLQANGLLNPRLADGKEFFWTTGSFESSRQVIRCLWGQHADVEFLPEPAL
jgi:glutamate racemase